MNIYKKRVSLEDRNQLYEVYDYEKNPEDLKALRKVSKATTEQLREWKNKLSDFVYAFPEGKETDGIFVLRKSFYENYELATGFDKESRSTWKYWFAHWCSFQMTAILLKCWKPKYLFHDIEKPILLSLTKDYKKVQRWHREHNRHHTEYALSHRLKDGTPRFDKIDWEAAVIDWECSRHTKRQAQMNARETLDWLISEDHQPWHSYSKVIKSYCEPILKKLGL